MKKLILLLFLNVLFTSNSVLAETFGYLIVEAKCGYLFSFGFSDNPTITFEDDNMIIKSKLDSHIFEISDVKEYYFSDMKVTGVEFMQADELNINYEGNDLVVIGRAHPSSKVKLFSVDGKEYKGNVSFSDNRFRINLNSMPKGVYIISIDNDSFKIYKK